MVSRPSSRIVLRWLKSSLMTELMTLSRYALRFDSARSSSASHGASAMSESVFSDENTESSVTHMTTPTPAQTRTRKAAI